MNLTKSMLLGAALLIAPSFEAGAQVPYYPYPYSYQVPVISPSLAAPPSWSYDPYTSGMGACVQHYPGDPPCRYTMHPTYGQPNYWPSH